MKKISFSIGSEDLWRKEGKEIGQREIEDMNPNSMILINSMQNFNRIEISCFAHLSGQVREKCCKRNINF